MTRLDSLVSAAGAEATGVSTDPMISGDGHFVAFGNYADNLIPVDGNTNYDIFVRDLVHSTTTRVSVSSAGVEQDLGSIESAISADGRYVVFAASSTNLVAGDSNGKSDIFLHDSLTGSTVQVSVDSAGGRLTKTPTCRRLAAMVGTSCSRLTRATLSWAIPTATQTFSCMLCLTAPPCA